MFVLEPLLMRKGVGEGNESKACFIISIQQRLHLLHIPTILKRRGKRERERERERKKGMLKWNISG